MNDTSCLLAGLVRLLSPALLLIFWHKKTGARFYPALIAFAVCLPVFAVGNMLRAGFSHENWLAYYVMQGVLFGILEEGGKHLMLRYPLSAYDSRNDAVSYGIGHSAYESFAAGLRCIGLIGEDNAAPDILFVQTWDAIAHPLWTAALTVLIFYGIRTEKSKIMLPIAIAIHAICNMSHGILIESADRALNLLILIGLCIAAFFCWRSLRDPFAEEIHF